MRDTPEGKLAHEQAMYFDKLVRIRDFRKITIAAVQGTCSAAGLMLACMCDLIVAADDAPLLQPRAAHVGRRRRAADRAVGARAAQGQGVPASARRRSRARRGRTLRPREPGRAASPSSAAERGRWPSSVALVPAAHRGDGEGVDQPHGRPDGSARELALPLHAPPVRARTRRPRSAKVDARKAGGMDAVKREQGESR